MRRHSRSRKTRHIELRAFFPQPRSARPEVRLVQIGTSDMFADCRHQFRYTNRDSDWTKNPVLNRFELGRKDRAEVCRNSNAQFCGCVLFPFSVARIHTLHNELRDDVYPRSLFVLSNVGNALQVQLRTTVAVPELDRETYLDSGAEDETHTSPSLCRRLHVPSL